MKKMLFILLSILVIIILCTMLLPKAPVAASTDCAWQLDPCVDEFGDATGKECYKSDVSGTFSDAISGNDMDVTIIYEDGVFSFRLYPFAER